MGLAKVLAVIAFLASSCAATSDGPDAPCDFAGVAINNDVFSNLIAKLPEVMQSGPQGFHSFLPGIQLGGITVHGLRRLRLVGPVVPYCINGTRMVKVEVFNLADAFFASHWKTLWDDEGTVMLRPVFGRFTLLFRIVNSTAEGVKVQLEEVFLTASQGARLVVEGAGRQVNEVVKFLSLLFPSILEEFSAMEFYKAIREALRII